MSIPVRSQLESELAILEEMLADIEEGRVIERLGLAARRDALRDELARLPRGLPPVSLTFRGEPVEGSRSISAEFGGRAVALFTEAVATVAASLTTELRSAGPLPGGNDLQLRIVGTTVGSFGFELELPAATSVLDGFPDPVGEAVDTTLALIDQAMVGDEDALSDVLSTIHPRAAAKVQDFVRLVVDRHALFAVRFGDKRLVVPDEEAGRRTLSALRTDELRQVEVEVAATLTGVLPHGRDFECRVDGVNGEQILRGKIDRGLDDMPALKGLLDRPVRLRLRETRLRAAHPRYVLLAAEERPAG